MGRITAVLLFAVAAAVCGCSDSPVTTQETVLSETPPESYREGKADLPWMEQDAASGWRDAMVCASSLGDGVVEGARVFGIGLWHLPGILAKLALALGREVIRREVDLVMSLTDREALQRVRETAQNDRRRLRELLATVRRTIPELWMALDAGTDWFETLDRTQKVQLVCEVTGRIAFDILVVIAGDKGLSRLMGLNRVHVVHNVQTRAMKVASVANMARLAKRAVVDVGAKLTGSRHVRWTQPALIFGPLAGSTVYRALAEGGGSDADVPMPMLSRHPDPIGELHLLVDAQGWEETPGYGYIDVILPTDHPAPAGSIAAEEGLSFELAGDIARALNPNIPSWDPDTFDVLAEGATFNRYFVPADHPTVSRTSQLSDNIARRLEHLNELTGEDLRPALHAIGEYADLTPVDRVDLLDELIEEANPH